MKLSMTTMCLFATLVATMAHADFASDDAPGALYPAWVIEVPDSVDGVLVADTSNASLHRFAKISNVFEWSDAHYMSIGLNGAAKERAWDKKTPLGTYFVTERLDTSRLHEKYGAAAFPLDYPNAWDRHNARTGYGIWLHGVDQRHPARPPRDTDGCLAIPNEELLEIADDIVPLVTPVIVVSKMQWVSEEVLEAKRLQLHMAIEQWQQSVRDGDLMAYLSLYDEHFQHRGLDKADWAAWRLQVFESRRLQAFEIGDLMLLADPVEDDLYLSRFTQVLDNGDGAVTTTKRLYWRRSDGDRWSIVAEDAG